MEQAIQKAIKGGWKPKHWMYESGLKTETIFEKTYLVIKDGVTTQHLQYSEVREDPLFWQALSKAEWWEGRISHDVFKAELYGDIEYHDVEPWIYHWHRFIDHLAEGKDIESFFKDLLAQ